MKDSSSNKTQILGSNNSSDTRLNKQSFEEELDQSNINQPSTQNLEEDINTNDLDKNSLDQKLTANNWYAKLHPTGNNINSQPQVKEKKRKRRIILNLSLFFRIWIAVGIIVVVSGIVVFNQLFNYVRPITQQVIEDTLVDTSKLLAASLQSAVESGEIYDANYQAMLDKAFYAPNLPQKIDGTNDNSPIEAIKTEDTNKTKALDKLILKSIQNGDKTPSTWYHKKTLSSFRVYVTDATGKVIYDSLPLGDITNSSETLESFSNAEGEDYSKWNDINLTLHGKYGARTTRTIEEDPSTSIMYVAQPIYASTSIKEDADYQLNTLQDNAKTSKTSPIASRNSSTNSFNESLNRPNADSSIGNRADLTPSILPKAGNSPTVIGVVSIGKPTATILPYLNATRKRMLATSLIISVITLIMAGLVAWWLRQSTLLVTRYTQSLAQDTKKPYFYLGRELNELTDTIETMKHRLENRAYVTDYVHTLTHELKSPLTAIRASGELLEDIELDNDDRLMLSQTITEQSIKLQSLIDRLLLLAKIEQPTFKLAMQTINPDELVKTLINGCQMQLQSQQLQINYNCRINNEAEVNILADEFWITQALQNVLDNAIYFAHTRVLITLSKERFKKIDYIKISVINDGSVIPEYALYKVFDRYFSLSHQRIKPESPSVNPLTEETVVKPNQSQGKKGTGLGLTLVKQVIERHEGNVGIRNIDLKDYDDSLAVSTKGVEVIIYLPTTPL